MKLIVSDLGTIKSNDMSDSEKFEETKIEVFLNNFERKLKQYYLDNEENEKGNYVNRKYGISKKGDNKYSIVYNENHYEFTNREDSIYYPMLKERLDALCDIDLEKDKIEKIIKQFENGNVSRNKEDISIYLKYLLSQKNNLETSRNADILVLIFGIIGVPLFLKGIAFSISLNSMFLGSLGMLASIALGVISGCCLLILPKAIRDIKGINKDMSINDLKIKKIEKISSDVETINKKIDSKINESSITGNIYKDNLINYMNSIMQASSKMNAHERKGVLLELRNILDEYTNKMKESKNNSKELTLDGDVERKILIETLDKLSSLEMVISEIMKRQSENAQITSESDLLRNQINSSIKTAVEEENLSEGQSLGLKM